MGTGYRMNAMVRVSRTITSDIRSGDGRIRNTTKISMQILLFSTSTIACMASTAGIGYCRPCRRAGRLVCEHVGESKDGGVPSWSDLEPVAGPSRWREAGRVEPAKETYRRVLPLLVIAGQGEELF